MTQKHHYKGLSTRQIEESRRLYGTNILTSHKKKTLWKEYVEKLNDPLIIILFIAGAFSIGISCYEILSLNKVFSVFFEPIGIFVAIFLATGLSFYFEHKANKEFNILNSVNDEESVEVIRNNYVTLIPRKDVVVGDIIVLKAGDEVPADAEILNSISLNIDESTLTGEPICYKSANRIDFDNKATYPTNHVLKGTKVMEGHAICKVFAVGNKTEQGKVFESIQIDDSVKTPLNQQLNGLSYWITKISYVLATLIIIGRITIYFITNGTNCFSSMEEFAPFIAYILQSLMIAITLIVVAVPEGLPMAVTLSLAYSMRRMLKTNNLVRKMHACETMGATTVICTDKTGTLTQNLMSVAELKLYNDIDEALINEGISVNSTASINFTNNEHPQVIGNPTEGALLLWLNEHGTNYQTIREKTKTLSEIPFSTERKYMATIVESNVVKDKKVLYVKGAPEIIYSLCKNTKIKKQDIEAQLSSYQAHAMRTLGFAYQIIDNNENVFDNNNNIITDKLQFIAIAAISDPIRKEVPNAVKKCIDAGISIKIVTGDTSGTAKEIARQINLWDDNTDTDDDNIITGIELSSLSDLELEKRISDFKIISRARPMDKKRLVETLKKLGNVVAVTGDGTNDAPALRAAHVGLSMGDGTSVAKEASDITIIDNSFNSITKAVMWGRSLYQNIQRFLLFQLTVNITACLLVVFGAFMGTESPLTVTQMLWINLIMDTFAAMALASLPPSERVMKDKPRNRNAFILSKSMINEIIGVGGIFFIILITLLFIFQHTNITQLTDLFNNTIGAKGYVSKYEITLLFTIFVMTHFFYLFNSAAFNTGHSTIYFKQSYGLISIAIIILVGQITMVELPILQQFFNVVGLKLIDWVIIFISSSIVIWIREIWHIIRKRQI